MDRELWQMLPVFAAFLDKKTENEIAQIMDQIALYISCCTITQNSDSMHKYYHDFVDKLNEYYSCVLTCEQWIDFITQFHSDEISAPSQQEADYLKLLNEIEKFQGTRMDIFISNLRTYLIVKKPCNKNSEHHQDFNKICELLDKKYYPYFSDLQNDKLGVDGWFQYINFEYQKTINDLKFNEKFNELNEILESPNLSDNSKIFFDYCDNILYHIKDVEICYLRTVYEKRLAEMIDLFNAII